MQHKALQTQREISFFHDYQIFSFLSKTILNISQCNSHKPQITAGQREREKTTPCKSLCQNNKQATTGGDNKHNAAVTICSIFSDQPFLVAFVSRPSRSHPGHPPVVSQRHCPANLQ